MKDFSDFRNNWLTDEKIAEMKHRSNAEAAAFEADTESYLATVSATFSLLLLAEYHKWINQDG